MNIRERNTDVNIITKIFSAYVVSLPITQYYKSPLSTFNLATFMAIVFFGYFTFRNAGRISLSKKSIPVFIFLGLITANEFVTAVLYHTDFAQMNLMSYLRTLLLVVSITIVGRKFFDRGFAFKALETLLLASALYMVLQLFCIYVLNYRLPGTIGSLVTMTGYVGGKDRPSGFYMEPANYAQSAILYIIFSLFRKTPWTGADKRNTVWIMLGILFSGSGQGYVLLVLVIVMWYLYRLFFTSFSKKNLIKGILIILACILVAAIVLNTSYGRFVLSRIISDGNGKQFVSLGGQALAGRTYTNKLFYRLSTLEQIFGVGFGRVNSVTGRYYVNSLYYYLIECGYVSIVFLLVMALIAFKNGNTGVRVYLLVYVFMFYFSGCGRTMLLCFNMMFILYETYHSSKYTIGISSTELINEKNINSYRT